MNNRGIRIAFFAAALAVIWGGAFRSEAAPTFLTAAVVSSQSIFGDFSANLAHFERLDAEAAAQGARLVCFPDLALVGHGHQPDLLNSASAELESSSTTMSESPLSLKERCYAFAATSFYAY